MRGPLDFMASDDVRFSALAAALALVGHVALAGLLLWRWNEASVDLKASSVQVTLVAAAGGEAESAAPSSRPPFRSPASAAAPAASSDLGETGRRLDDLLGHASAAERAPSPAPSSAPASNAQSSGANGAPGLKAGEGLAGIDVFAGAALPIVGTRPANPSGRFWNQVEACWRSPGRLSVVLLVELDVRGGVSRLQAIRPQGQVIDGSRLAAERSAARAIEACAPYIGLGAGRERLEFRP